jgi:muramidase (phage lysozyme)
MTRSTADQLGGQNIAAFLDMLAFSEIGPAMLAGSDDGYNVLVGSTPGNIMTFASYAAHPDVLNRATDSDAAGRYQIMHHWWVAYDPILHLPDFGPVSQDLYALNQLKERKAIAPILAGDLAAAVTACSNIWASLPGSTYGQHENQFAALQAAYVAAGGTLT